jgi:hypothetical protein
VSDLALALTRLCVRLGRLVARLALMFCTLP